VLLSKLHLVEIRSADNLQLLSLPCDWQFMGDVQAVVSQAQITKRSRQA
jgi:hypothetical protein